MKKFIFKDFPKKGVNFIDIFSSIMDTESRLEISDFLYNNIPSNSILFVPESRAFLFAGLFLNEPNVYIVPFRKEGKLPYNKLTDIVSVQYNKEYGTDTLQVSREHLRKLPADKSKYSCIVLDDVLATGSTAIAIASVLEDIHNIKLDKFLFIFEIQSLEGRIKCEEIAEVKSLTKV